MCNLIFRGTYVDISLLSTIEVDWKKYLFSFAFFSPQHILLLAIQVFGQCLSLLFDHKLWILCLKMLISETAWAKACAFSEGCRYVRIYTVREDGLTSKVWIQTGLSFASRPQLYVQLKRKLITRFLHLTCTLFQSEQDVACP